EAGDKTDEPIKTRGWTHWHHLFGARGLFTLALFRKNVSANTLPCFLEIVNFSSRLCRWRTSGKRMAKDGSGKQTGGASDDAMDVFPNQALNKLANYAIRSEWRVRGEYNPSYVKPQRISHIPDFEVLPAFKMNNPAYFYITHPPYADAINYHEITEF